MENKVHIGDTPEQLDVGLLINGEFWSGSRIAALQADHDALAAQLVEVTNGATGQAPCERYCEAFAVKKAVDNLIFANKQLKDEIEKNKIPDDYITVPSDAWFNLAQQEKIAIEIQPAYHQLKEAIAGVEICGVPIHHLSHDIEKHFRIDTVNFSLDMKLKHFEEIRKQLRKSSNENHPAECSDDMINGWKSAMFEVFSFLDSQIAELSLGLLPNGPSKGDK